MILLGFEIGQRWPEAMMHSWGSYFIPVPKPALADVLIRISINKSSELDKYQDCRYICRLEKKRVGACKNN